MINPAEMIALPWDRGYMYFKRGMLETAILVYLETTDAGYTYPTSLSMAKEELIAAHGFARNDAVLYPVAAKVCLERGIEP